MDGRWMGPVPPSPAPPRPTQPRHAGPPHLNRSLSRMATATTVSTPVVNATA